MQTSLASAVVAAATPATPAAAAAAAAAAAFGTTATAAATAAAIAAADASAADSSARATAGGCWSRITPYQRGGHRPSGLWFVRLSYGFGYVVRCGYGSLVRTVREPYAKCGSKSGAKYVSKYEARSSASGLIALVSKLAAPRSSPVPKQPALPLQQRASTEQASLKDALNKKDK